MSAFVYARYILMLSLPDKYIEKETTLRVPG